MILETIVEPQKGWTISVSNGLRASFLQPDGPSRLGTDWLVIMSLGNQQHKVFVRAYADEFPQISKKKESELILGYVARLLDGGWSPSEYRGQPGELTYKGALLPSNSLPKPTKRSWWKFLSS